MTMIGKSRPVRTAALRLSSANRCSRPATSLAGTECLDIFSPAPGDSDVISQALRDNSIETKIAPRSVRIGACAGRGASLSIIGSRVGASATSLFWSEGRQPNAHRIFRLKRPMPRIGGFQSFHTARRTIRGFEAMLWLRKGFDFAGAWTVREQNRLLSVCFGLPKVNKPEKRAGFRSRAAYVKVCVRPRQGE